MDNILRTLTITPPAPVELTEENVDSKAKWYGLRLWKIRAITPLFLLTYPDWSVAKDSCTLEEADSFLNTLE